MGAAEGVIDKDVAETGEFLGEDGVVGFFFWVKAEIFKQEGLAGFEVVGQLGGDLADAVGGEGYVLVLIHDVVEEQAEAVDDGTERSCSRRLFLWAGRGASRE